MHGNVLTIPDARTRELDRRREGGLEVALLWHVEEDRVTICVDDARTGDYFEVEVPRDRALDAFRHPYVYRRAAEPSPRAA